MMDLTSRYMGLDLRNPLVASASPLAGTVDGVRALADAGVAAVVLPSLFEEELEREMGRNVAMADAGTESFAESLSYFPAAAGAEVSTPVAVKLSPYFSSPGEMALRLDGVGADGLVLFNRFIQPDIDPEALTITVGFGLSSRDEGRLPRAWIARLAGRVRASLAASTGVSG